MKVVNINFTDSTLGPIGRAGEHNKTRLVFELTSDLQKCDLITAEFNTFDGNKIIVEDAEFDEGRKTLTVKLTRQLAVEGMLRMQLVGYVVEDETAEPQVIAKSPVVSGYITPGINGVEANADSNPSLLDRIWTKMQSWAEKIHEHSNKKIIDGFRCFAYENPFYNALDANDLTWNGATLRLTDEGAVVREMKEVEIEGEKFLRLYLHWGNGVILEGERDFIDIPITGTEKVEESYSGITLNGTGLVLPTGDGSEGGGITITDDGNGNVTIV